MKKKLQKIFIILTIFLIGVSVFAQTDEPETQILELKDSALQRAITVVDLPHNYDLNPHTACYSSESQILTGLYEGLYSYDPITLDPTPAIAISYKISRDKKKWTFVLRDNAMFSNGELITAQSIRDSWIDLLAEPSASFSSLIDSIKGAKEFRNGQGTSEDVAIEARDEHTLVVRLNEPTEHLPRILCHHSLAAVSREPNVYSGAFVLESYDGTTLVMNKNENYYDKASVSVPKIIFTQNENSEENAYLFNTGKTDWVTSSVDTSKILNKDSIHIAAEFGTQYIFFKGQNKPWNDPDFRNALLSAVPWDELRKSFYVPATTLVYRLVGYPVVMGITDYDVCDAIEMMNVARKKLGFTLDEKIPIVFAITDTDYMKDQADFLKAAWEPLGVELIIQKTPTERYNSSIQGWNADLFTYTWIGDFADPLAFLELFRGGSSLNISQYNNSEYNLLLAQAANADDNKDHYKYLSQAEQLLLDDGMILPISHPVSLHVIDLETIGGWSVNALDIHPLKYLFIKNKVYNIPNLVRK